MHSTKPETDMSARIAELEAIVKERDLTIAALRREIVYLKETVLPVAIAAATESAIA